MRKLDKPGSFSLLKPKQRLLPLNNKQNSNNIFKKLACMDGPTSSQERRPPRSLKHIQTQANIQNSSIINVNTLLQKNFPQSYSSLRKVEEAQTYRDREPVQQIKFRQAIEQQIQNDVDEYLVQSRKKNRKNKILRKKQGRKFSNPDEFSQIKNL